MTDTSQLAQAKQYASAANDTVSALESALTQEREIHKNLSKELCEQDKTIWKLRKLRKNAISSLWGLFVGDCVILLGSCINNNVPGWAGYLLGLVVMLIGVCMYHNTKE